MNALERELALADPDVPFRASADHVHHTWAQTFHSRPELYIQPHTLEEVQKVVNLARRCKRRIVTVGSGHSPSELTCTSSWMVNLDKYNKVLQVNLRRKTLVVEAGIRLHELNAAANKHGLTMPNLGSINEQSIAGAISTATHGSSLKHGLLSDSVRSIRIVLSNGQAVRCSQDQNQDLFRAALISLGALGIIVEVEFEMTDACNIEWEQTLVPLRHVLDNWDGSLWTQKEFTRVWWLPYTKRAVVWAAEKTEKPVQKPKDSWYGGLVGYNTYHNLLRIANFLPFILPTVEWFVFGMQYGFSNYNTTSAIEELQNGLLMNCLYSQFVNEWALPIEKGPEAITRLSAWLNGERGGGNIPFSARGLWVHAPIEVRVSDTSRRSGPRPFLDNTASNGATLYLNATLYRAFHRDPPCRARYYQAFEWLMQDLGGKPHYAKNFAYTSSEQLSEILGADLKQWLKVRNEADPEGIFLGHWHRRALGLGRSQFAHEERETSRVKNWKAGGLDWTGEVPLDSVSVPEAFNNPPLALTDFVGSPSARSSVSSFDMLHGAEAEKSVLLSGSYEGSDDDLTDRDEQTSMSSPRGPFRGLSNFELR